MEKNKVAGEFSCAALNVLHAFLLVSSFLSSFFFANIGNKKRKGGEKNNLPWVSVFARRLSKHDETPGKSCLKWERDRSEQFSARLLCISSRLFSPLLLFFFLLPPFPNFNRSPPFWGTRSLVPRSRQTDFWDRLWWAKRQRTLLPPRVCWLRLPWRCTIARSCSRLESRLAVCRRRPPPRPHHHHLLKEQNKSLTGVPAATWLCYHVL